MPAKTSAAAPAEPPKAQDPFKFEVSLKETFHFILTASPATVSVDVGALGTQKTVAVAIPPVVRSTAESVYAYTAPRVQWAVAKLTKKTE